MNSGNSRPVQFRSRISNLKVLFSLDSCRHRVVIVCGVSDPRICVHGNFAKHDHELPFAEQYSFMQETQATNSFFQMTVSAWAADPAGIPSHVAVNYWVTVIGTVYFNHGCWLNYQNG